MKLINFDLSSHRLSNNDTLLEKELNTFFIFLEKENKKNFPHFTKDSRLKLIFKICISKKGLNFLLKDNYFKRLIFEIEEILQNNERNILDYFLFWEEISFFFERKNKTANIGRGTSASSLVNYLLGVTKIDPIKENLLFETWYKRDELPIIDFDVNPDDRKDLIEFLKTKYNKNYKSLKIQSFYKLKPCFKYLLDLMNLKYEKKESLIKVLEPYLIKSANKSQKEILMEVIEKESVIHDFLLLNPDVNDYLFEKLDKVKEELLDHETAFILSDENYVLLSDIESKKIPKFNVLGNSQYKKNICFKKIEQKNEEQWLNLSKNINSNFYKSLNILKKYSFFNPKEYSLMTAAVVISLARPAPLSVIDLFKQPNDQRIKNELYETNGVLIFEEQIMKIISSCLDVSLFDSIKIMREMKLRSKNYLDKKEIYINKIGFKGEDVLNYIEASSRYVFNKSHAISYAYLDYYANL